MAYKTQQTKGQSERQSGRVGNDGARADHSSPFGTPKCLAASGIYPRLLSPSARLDSTSPGRTCLSLCVCHHQHRHQRRRLLRWQPWRDRRSKGEVERGERGRRRGLLIIILNAAICHLWGFATCPIEGYSSESVSMSLAVSLFLYFSPSHSLCACVGVLGWLASKLWKVRPKVLLSSV